MLYGMYISAAGAMANSYRQDVVANNLANIDTAAFKKDMALFQSRPTEAQGAGSGRLSSSLLEKTGGGLFSLPTYTDFSQGSFDKTGSSYDVALNGEGFFQVQDGKGVSYTRDGRFMVGADGVSLITVSGGLPVLDNTGNAIKLVPGITPEIDRNGFVSQSGQNVAQIGLVDFKDKTQLRKKGGNLYQADAAGAVSSNAQMLQGHTEVSGVNAMEELTAMIKTQRLFQNNVTMLQIQDQTLGAVISKMGNIA